MKQILTKGLWGARNSGNGCQLLGMHHGQMRPDRLVHDAGWYNQRGESLGWGDLGPVDFSVIRDNITAGEMFIALSERNSCCEGTKLDVEAPGIDYVAEKACYIVSKEGVFAVDDSWPLDRPMVRHGLQFVLIRRAKVLAFIKGA